MSDAILPSYLSSGGHLNPAVTLGVFLAGGINVVAVVCYFFAQVLGGVTGAACVLVSVLSIFDNISACLSITVTKVGTN